MLIIAHIIPNLALKTPYKIINRINKLDTEVRIYKVFITFMDFCTNIIFIVCEIFKN